ncbi:MAG: 50S ribosomal protein L6 [Christensenellales bacterium]|jgi:large subunit ribosomal protein L6
MSRIGKLPVEIPSSVTVTVAEGNAVKVKGPKGELSGKFDENMIIEIEGNVLTVKRPSEQKRFVALHGLIRTLINNMVVGVSAGFEKKLEIMGVGYRAQKQGEKLVLTLGYSHPVEIEPPAGIAFDVPTPTKITVSGIDKQLVGAIAADIRAKRKPEPYKGKGVRYEGEYVRRKEGKTGK